MSGKAKHLGDTFDRGRAPSHKRPRMETVLRLAWHPDLARVGESVTLPEGGGLALNRLEPEFSSGRPLDDPFLSRRSIELCDRGDRVELWSPDGAEAYVLGQRLGPSPMTLEAEQLDAGVDLTLGGRVLLWLERAPAKPAPAERHGIEGYSQAVLELLETIATRGAALPKVTLITGPTGSGKEMVARALHRSSPRRERPLVAVNVAAIPSSTAAAALFGHARGAFTGAEGESPGYFGQARGGILFLDEIGELSAEVQPMLLRALESAEIQPVGRSQVESIDVAVIAATDAALEEKVAAGSFRAPLWHRLAASVIEVPPLSARGADPAILLAQALLSADAPLAIRDASLEAHPALGLELVQTVLRFAWPGNVRQLQTIVRQILERTRRQQALDPRALGLGDAPPEAERPTPRHAEAKSDAEILQALEAHGYRPGAAARALGISRTYLDQRIAQGGLARKSTALSAEEIGAALERAETDLERAAAELRVSPRGLKLRMTQLGLDLQGRPPE
ncbi:MAG: sigma 54-interacting transcriptional regulator [Myxococcota bacterium]